MTTVPSCYPVSTSSPDSIVTCGTDRTVRVWSLIDVDRSDGGAGPAGEIVVMPESAYRLPNTLSSVAVNAAGNQVAVGDVCGNVTVMNMNANKLDVIGTVAAHHDDVLSLDFSKGGDHPLLASAGKDKVVKVHSVKKRPMELTTLAEHTDAVTCVKFAPISTRVQNGPSGRLITASDDKTVIFRNISFTQKSLRISKYSSLSSQNSAPCDIAIDSSGRYVS